MVPNLNWISLEIFGAGFQLAPGWMPVSISDLQSNAKVEHERALGHPLSPRLLREGRLVVQPVKPGSNTEAGRCRNFSNRAEFKKKPHC